MSLFIRVKNKRIDSNKLKMFILCLLFLISTISLGHCVLISIRKQAFSGSIELSLSWLFGESITSLTIYLTSLIFALNMSHVIAIIVIQVIISSYLYRKTYDSLFGISRQCLKFNFENFPGIFFLCLIAVFVAFHYSTKIFSSFPGSISNVLKSSAENDYNITLLLNKNECKRSEIKGSVLPHIYTSSLCACGISYEDASIFISCFNAYATACSIYITSVVTAHPMINSMLILFQCRAMFSLKENDNTYSLIQVLCLSKEASFSIPFIFFGISLAQTIDKRSVDSIIIAMLIECFIPNAYLSLLYLASLLMSSSMRFKFLPCIITLFPKLYNSGICIKPMWNYTQSNNMLFSFIITFWNAFGPYIFSPLILLSRSIAKKYIKTPLLIFIIVCFIAQDSCCYNDVYRSAAIMSIVSPSFIIVCVSFLSNFMERIQLEVIKSTLLVLIIISFFVVVSYGMIITF